MQRDARSAILLTGQTIAHNILDEVTGTFTRVELKIPCWKDEHMPLGALAVLLLCVFVIGYPAITYWQMRSSTAFLGIVMHRGGAFLYCDLETEKRYIVQTTGHSERRMSRWSHFVSDYTAEHFWFRHITFMLVVLPISTML